MKTRQLLYLFICDFAILFTGAGLFPLLPLYDAHFGATRTLSGMHLTLLYASITIGTLIAGALAKRLTR